MCLSLVSGWFPISFLCGLLCLLWLNMGQSIIDYMILNKYIDPSGWWQGRLRGKQGLLPGNYVQKLWWRHPKGRKTIISITKNIWWAQKTTWRDGAKKKREKLLIHRLFFLLFIFLNIWFAIVISPKDDEDLKIRFLILKNSSYSMKRDFTFKKKQ